MKGSQNLVQPGFAVAWRSRSTQTLQDRPKQVSRWHALRRWNQAAFVLRKLGTQRGIPDQRIQKSFGWTELSGRAELSRIGGSGLSQLHPTGAWGEFQWTGRVDGWPFRLLYSGHR
jgi:hypothetical protein